ncbi:sulfotransferase family protein [Leptothoe spongobia]|uniref:Sulfotransferase n=1 Tax=Leptothoe spongobia TAU-MAC 1115 TaxID=1967444 RepID=A0A947DI03_9CYAN|nr:sulfotransferase [Leptothoe spongobia]MBT9317282.1 sulfotransferase [Leptothoe spongobia TAU-MAC 1115]
MNSQTLFPQERPLVESITRNNILRWARRTYNADCHTYFPKQRSFQLSRLLFSAVPNLNKPLFIIGAPRSGTTFLGKCIANLPEISYHFEPIATKAAARYVYDKLWTHRQAKWFYQSVYSWLLRIHFDGDLQFAEKTPRNCFLVPFLSKAFPDAQFIHIIRDGRDVALSLSKKPWFLASQAGSGKYEPGGYPYGPYAQFWVAPEKHEEFETTTDLHRCSWVWNSFTKTALEKTRQLPNDSYLELRYESLAHNPMHEARRILEFLDIVNSDSNDAFNKTIRSANPTLIGQWKREFSEKDLEKVYSEAGPLLNLLNYTEVQ